MSEPPPFELPPPVEPLPQGPRPPESSSDANAVPLVAPPVPPPAGPPSGPPAPPAVPPPPRYAPPPAPRPLSRGAVAGITVSIVAGALVLVGLLVGAVTVLVIAGVEANDRDIRQEQPLLSGDPGIPVAVEPLECTGPCFDESSLPALTAPAERFARLGLVDETTPPEFAEHGTAGELAVRDAQTWREAGGSPDECFFATTSAPYAAVLPDLAAPDATGADDPLVFLATHEDRARIDLADHSVRIFPDTAAATAYLTALADAISGCDQFGIQPEGERREGTVTPLPALSVPDEVAAVGWVREGQPGPRWRAYVVDIQRGNVVLRIRIFTDGLITEQQFRNTVELYAKQVATVEPVGATVSP